MYGVDAPYSLFTHMLHQATQTIEDPDIILLPGDFVAHDIAADAHDNITGNFTLVKDTISKVFQEIRSFYPNALILPTLGNNDVKNHYQPPTDLEKEDYYNFLYQEWISP